MNEIKSIKVCMTRFGAVASNNKRPVGVKEETKSWGSLTTGKAQSVGDLQPRVILPRCYTIVSNPYTHSFTRRDTPASALSVFTISGTSSVTFVAPTNAIFVSTSARRIWTNLCKPLSPYPAHIE